MMNCFALADDRLRPIDGSNPLGRTGNARVCNDSPLGLRPNHQVARSSCSSNHQRTIGRIQQ